MSGKARGLFKFASLALMTQGVLLLNQIVLLPIQLRVWKTDVTAEWYAILAVAAMTTISDLGLRQAGHAHLIRWVHDPSDDEARLEFTHLWAWIRILCLVTTTALVIGDYAFAHFYQHQQYPLWRTALLLGIAIELPAGTRLPTVRQLADQLGVAPGTVARAYKELEADRVIETRGRNGTFIAAGGDAVTREAFAAAVAYVARIRRLGLTEREALAHVTTAFEAL